MSAIGLNANAASANSDLLKASDQVKTKSETNVETKSENTDSIKLNNTKSGIPSSSVDLIPKTKSENSNPYIKPNSITPFLGFETRGEGIIGATYSRAFSILPIVTGSLLDGVVDASGSYSTSKTLRTEVSPGLRLNAYPIFLPFYAQYNPIGAGVKVEDKASPYIPMKAEAGIDTGSFTLGAYYQHNFVFGSKDDNLLGVRSGLKF